jgi:hypothetical protein
VKIDRHKVAALMRARTPYVERATCDPLVHHLLQPCAPEQATLLIHSIDYFKISATRTEIRPLARGAGVRRVPMNDNTVNEYYVAYCDHYATGEGRRTMIAIGGSEAQAEKIFKEHADEFWHQGLVLSKLSELEDDIKIPMLSMIPEHFKKLCLDLPRGAPMYYGEHSYNLS